MGEGWGAVLSLHCQALTFSSCASHWGVFSCCGAWVPEWRGGLGASAVVASAQLPPRLCGVLVPRPGIKPASLALVGRCLTTGPPGKSLNDLLFN